jgi:soluble lytic murein transglycosylase-like protein
MITSVTLPAVSKSSNTATALAKAKANMDNAIANKFATAIAKAERLSGVPKEMFVPFMQHESECQNIPNARGSSARGPMQVMPVTAVDSICICNKWISAECKAEITRMIGAKRANGYFKKGMDGSTAIKKYGGISAAELLANPELSILVACLQIAFLLRRHTNTSTGQIDICKVLAQYAQGINFKVIGNTPEQVLTYCRIRPQAYNYIISMVGKNGLMTAYIS